MKGAGDHTSSGGVWPLRWVLERPRLCIALVLLLVCGLALGLGRLRFESSYEVYFDRDNPRLRALDALYARFSRNDNVLFALAPRAGADTMRLQAFSPKVLAAVQDLTRSAWQLPYASRVDSVANHLHIDSDADGVRIEPLLDDETVPDEASSRRVASIALNQHALLNRLVAADGNTLGVNVRLQLPNGDRRAVTEATDAARVLAERIRARHAGVEVWVTGNAVLNAAFMQTGQRDLLTLTPAMYLVMALVLCWLLGSVRAALIALGITTASILVGLGFAGWAGLAMTSASIAAPTIIATVALVGTIHVLTTVHRELQSDATPTAVPGARAAPALARALTLNALPVTITSLTTGLGFLSLNLSDAPPFRDLGNIAAVGTLAAWLLTLAVLPAVLHLYPGLMRGRGPGRHRWLTPAGALIVRHRRTLALLCAALCTVLGLFIPHMALNDSFVEYFDRSIEFRRDTEIVESRLTGIYQLEYVLDSGESQGVHDPTFLGLVADFQAWLEQQPEVRHVDSIVEVLQRLHRHLAEGTSAASAPGDLPGTRELAAQYLLAYEMSVPYGLDLNDRIDVERRATRLSIRLAHLDNQAMRALEARIDAWFAQHAPASMRPTALGAAIMFAYIAQKNIAAMLESSVVAMLLIAVVLALVYRSVVLGVLSLVPNVLPAIAAFGLWSLLVGRMGVALTTVFPMVLGIVLDDTIHFMNGYLRARQTLGVDQREALQYTFRHVGPALVNTSIVLVCGFGVLSLSGFEPNQGMARLTALMIAWALLTDFLILPAVLGLAERLRGGAGARRARSVSAQ